MLDDFKKSIQLILHERITSPFSGAFFFSWLVWNWKFIYFLIVDADMVTSARIAHAETSFGGIDYHLFYPLVSAIFLVVFYPFVTTGALRVWLGFRKWQTQIRNKIEDNQLLTREQSIALRLELQKQQGNFHELIKAKDDEIANLNNQLKNITQLDKGNELSSKLQKEINEFLLMPNVVSHFEKLISNITGNYSVSVESYPPNFLGFLVSSNIIQLRDGKTRQYDFTEKGKLFVKEFTKSRLDKNSL